MVLVLNELLKIANTTNTNAGTKLLYVYIQQS